MLTYCTNIHPGETWEEMIAAVWPRVIEVKRRTFPHRLFPVGLRLSARAARQATPRVAAEFLETCTRQGCFIATINGFPYGPFHDDGMKERVYLPDWRDRKRAEYTLDLVRLLEIWLPAAVTGSISTLPVGYRTHVRPDDLRQVRENLLLVLQELERVAARGRKIVLALEPEPGCVLETTEDVARFVETLRLPDSLRPFLGVCFDCCHAAVMFDDPAAAFTLLRDAGIPVPKIHVSSAASITRNHAAAARLFHEPRYLHQTTVRQGSGTEYYPDIGRAIAADRLPAGEWRVHFHLPIFDDGNEVYGTTNGYIRQVLACRPPGSLLEIETYTYQVLPREVTRATVTDFICREFYWLRSCL